MSATNDGGPAFPRQAVVTASGIVEYADAYLHTGGMSLRDYFAAAALTGLIAQSPIELSATQFASEAFIAADAMLAARERNAS